MTSSERLAILKKNLQRINGANDDFLLHLLQQSSHRFEIMAITDDGSPAYDEALIDFAAYLFRNRDKNGMDSEMPRFLRKEINDLKLHQAAVAAEGGTS